MNRIFLLVFVSLISALAVQSSAQENVYEPGVDPKVGFHLISFRDQDPTEVFEIFDTIRSMKIAGCKHISIGVYRRVDDATGLVQENTGSSFLTITHAIRMAKRQGMAVTLTPIFETTSGKWRGTWNPGGEALGDFRRSYYKLLVRLAIISQAEGVERLNVGSEMVAFVNRGGNMRFWRRLMTRMEQIYSGQLGYVANWDNYQSPFVERVFWQDDRIDAIAISMYPTQRLASIYDCDLSERFPENFSAFVQLNWENLFQNEVFPYAAQQKQGQGMPIIVGEFGAVPYNRCANVPWSIEPGADSGGLFEQVDAFEQEAVIMGLIRALDQQGDLVKEAHIWQWGWGDHSDRFGLDPFFASPQQQTALTIMNYLLSNQ